MSTRGVSLYLGRVGLRAVVASDFWWVTIAQSGQRKYLLCSITSERSKSGLMVSLHLLWLKLAVYIINREKS